MDKSITNKNRTEYKKICTSLHKAASSVVFILKAYIQIKANVSCSRTYEAC